MRREIGLLAVATALMVGGCKKKKDEGAGTATGRGAATGTGAASAEPGSGPASGAAAADPALVARGKYLTSIAGCPLCHTPLDASGMAQDQRKAFAGGLEMKEAFGTWRSPNITQDKVTGIGAWTDAQIIAGIRDGKRPDGTMIKAIMPYMFYTAMTDDDAKAMVAYLRTVAPVANKVEPLPIPLPDMPAPPMPRVDDTSDPVKHGQYLTTLMHCAACHTPMGPMGPDMAKMFAGGGEMELPPAFGTGKVYASNLTSHEATGLGKWTEADVVKAVTTMVRPDGKPIFGPMMFYAPMWSQLTPEDATAVAKFIKAIPPIENQVPASTFVPAGPPPGAPPPAPTAAP